MATCHSENLPLTLFPQVTMRLTARLQPAGDLGSYGTLSTPGMAFLIFPQQPISSDETAP